MYRHCAGKGEGKGNRGQERGPLLGRPRGFPVALTRRCNEGSLGGDLWFKPGTTCAFHSSVCASAPERYGGA